MMDGKTVIVTGGTNGIGRETVRGLARMGANLIVIARNQEKGESVVAALREATDNPNITFMTADLSLQADIRRVADAIKARLSRLDGLVNNAGAYFPSRQMTTEGLEMNWAFNHLGYFSLTLHLLDLLKASAPARIVNVSSAAYTAGKIPFDDLQAAKSYKGFGRYSATKLANILFTLELARRLEGTGVTANVLHPGMAATQEGKSLLAITGRLFMKLFGTTVEEAAQTSIYLASSPEVEGVSGQYFEKCKPKALAKAALDPDLPRKLWEISLQQTQIRVAI